MRVIWMIIAKNDARRFICLLSNVVRIIAAGDIFYNITASNRNVWYDCDCR